MCVHVNEKEKRKWEAKNRIKGDVFGNLATTETVNSRSRWLKEPSVVTLSALNKLNNDLYYVLTKKKKRKFGEK